MVSKWWLNLLGPHTIEKSHDWVSQPGCSSVQLRTLGIIWTFTGCLPKCNKSSLQDNQIESSLQWVESWAIIQVEHIMEQCNVVKLSKKSMIRNAYKCLQGWLPGQCTPGLCTNNHWRTPSTFPGRPVYVYSNR